MTCYNMAAAALYGQRNATEERIAVNVRFGDGSVAVPVLLKQTQTTGTERFFSGSGVEPVTIENENAGLPAGLAVGARIHVSGGQISDAVFDEATLIGSPARALGRVACTLKRSGTVLPNEALPEAVSS